MIDNVKKYHVMHVVENLEVGGMENGVVNLANLIDKDRFKFTICCLSHPGALSKRLKDVNIEVLSLGWSRGFSPKLFLKLAHTFKERNVDIIHTHGWLTLIYSSVASIIARIPVLINGEHGAFQLDNFRRKIAYTIISAIVDWYVVVSYSLEKELANILKSNVNNILTIPNGVDLQKFSPLRVDEVASIRSELGIPTTARVIGSVGRLEPVKNYEMLLRVFAKLSKNYLDIHCILIGDGSLKAKLEELAIKLEIADRVHFAGQVDNPNQLISILDLFVSTSFSEGMSNTILEAMACGKPIVATDVGDSGKLVDEGHNGLLVQSEDIIGLEKAIIQILYDKNMLKMYGENSRLISVEKYSITKMVCQYQDIYLQSIADKRGVYAL